MSIPIQGLGTAALKARFRPSDTDGMMPLLAASSSSGGDPNAPYFWFAVVVVVIGVWIAALVDALLVPDDSLYKSGSKVMWVPVIVLLGVIGAAIYAFVGAPTADNRRRFAEFRSARATHLPSAATASGFSSPPPRSGAGLPAPAQAPEFKSCPDCAEEIRFAARKCRFCGHMFEDVRGVA